MKISLAALTALHVAFLPSFGLAQKDSPNFNSRPNILFLLVDDWGAGDVDMCPDDVPYEHCPFVAQSQGRQEVLHTPRIKKMASEGMIMSNYYSPRGICTTSRAGLLAGRDPTHFAMTDSLVQLLGSPSVRGGFPQEETTFAEYLRDLNYTTGFSGKWHLGMTNGTHPVAHTPLMQGYDEVFFFVEGSNGETCEAGALNPPGDNNVYHCCAFDHVQNCDKETETCEVVEQPIRWENATARHLKAGLDFIEKHKDDEEPWMYSHHFLHVHVPWVPSRHFVTHKTLKFWTDMVGEVDWAVGVFLEKLKQLQLDENTLVILTSDNGPYKESASSFCPQNCKITTPDKDGNIPSAFMCSACDANTVSLSLTGEKGSTGGKGMTWEGGQRVPGIFWWPKKIPAGSVNPVVASSLDFLPTAVSLAGGVVDPEVSLDGRDLSFTLFQKPDPAAEPEGSFVYFCGVYPMAVRMGRHKIIWRSQKFVGKTKDSPTSHNHCAGKGDCCVDTPTRLCNCQWANDYSDAPIVIDLIENSYEDRDQALDPADSATQDIVAAATELRTERVRSVMISRELPFDGLSTEDQIEVLAQSPNLLQVDFCAGPSGLNINLPPGQYWCNDAAGSPPIGGCNLVPEICQIPEFAPYENCSIVTYQGSECQIRLPCGEQEGYMGPFEYVKPMSANNWEQPWERCGAYKNGPNSYFPDDMAQSLCQWQDDVLTDLKARNLYHAIDFCRHPICANSTVDNDQVCNDIFVYGLNNIPTGVLYNSPYPDDQTDMTLMYGNQDTPPPTAEYVDVPMSTPIDIERTNPDEDSLD